MAPLIFAVLMMLYQGTDCANRGTWSASGQYEYYVSPGGDTKPYNDAQAYCNGQGGELALVKTQEVQQFIQTLVSANGVSGIPYAFVVGLRNIGSNGTFIWNDGDALSYTNWQVGEPGNSGNCVVLGSSFTFRANLPWYDVQCTSSSGGFVCQRQLDQWTPWSECSSTCEPGKQTRTRTCNSQDQSSPSSTCQGRETETRACSTDFHNVDKNLPTNCVLQRIVSFETKKNLNGGNSNKVMKGGTVVQTQDINGKGFRIGIIKITKP